MKAANEQNISKDIAQRQIKGKRIRSPWHSCVFSQDEEVMLVNKINIVNSWRYLLD